MENMEKFLKLILSAQPGQIIPLVREIDIHCPVEFFAKLSDYGRKKHCCLFESRDHLDAEGADELTFGTANPALYLTGSAETFYIEALSETGRRMIAFLAKNKSRFAFCETVSFSDSRITGKIKISHQNIDEQSRLKSTNQMDVLRAVTFAFSLAGKPFRVTCGLLGALSYDFIDQFEQLPPNQSDILQNPDYELYFADNMFLLDHRDNKGYILVNAVITDNNREQILRKALDTFEYYEKIAQTPPPTPQKYTPPQTEIDTDTPQPQYEQMVKTAKQHIIDGDIFQVVLSRTITAPCPA
ncbi:MAG: chorismate-binding protein, partial [Deltaproteobacteria bacterium]|nr:chorismate-binding protein [Deltaproteobacteria bacterium]